MSLWSTELEAKQEGTGPGHLKMLQVSPFNQLN